MRAKKGEKHKMGRALKKKKKISQYIWVDFRPEQFFRKLKKIHLQLIC